MHTDPTMPSTAWLHATFIGMVRPKRPCDVAPFIDARAPSAGERASASTHVLRDHPVLRA